MAAIERKDHAQATVGMRDHGRRAGRLHSGCTCGGHQDSANERLVAQLMRGSPDEVCREVDDFRRSRAGHDRKLTKAEAQRSELRGQSPGPSPRPKTKGALT